MDYFSVMRIGAALLLSILIVFTIIFFVSQTPGLAIQKLMLGPLSKEELLQRCGAGNPLVFTGLGLTLCLKAVSSTSALTHPFTWELLLPAQSPLPAPSKRPAPAGPILAAAVVGGVISMLPVIVNKYVPR